MHTKSRKFLKTTIAALAFVAVGLIDTLPAHAHKVGVGIGIGRAFGSNGIIFGFGGHRHAHHHTNYRVKQHIAWCAKRYRSYDVRTDSFQPYKGRRKRCNSPYFR